MRRALASLLSIWSLAFFVFGLAVNNAVAANICCKCHPPGSLTDSCLQGEGGTCADLLAGASNPGILNYQCNPKPLAAAECKTINDGGLCSKVSSAGTFTETSPPLPSSQPMLSVPEPSIEVPGLYFTALPSVSEGKVTIPFIAQYVAAFYRYLIGLSMVVAAVMLVYGGFLYVVGSTTGSVQSSKEIIKNSLAGLILILCSFMLLNIVNPDAAKLKPLAVNVVTRDIMEDWYAQNGTTYLGSPTSEPKDVGGQPGGGGPEGEVPTESMQTTDLVDVSGISYDSSASACENITKFCGYSQARSATTFQQKQKLLAKAVLGFYKVCISNGRCVYSQAAQSNLSSCSLGSPKPLAFFSVPALKKIGMTPESIWPDNPECVEAWNVKRTGPMKVNTMEPCNTIARNLYNERIVKKIEEAKVFASDCVGFVTAIYGCAGAKGVFWGNDLTAAVVSLSKNKVPTKFLQRPQLVVFTRIGDPELDAKLAEKGGLKFGDIIFVTGGTGQNAMHYYLYTGGRKDVPFTFIEMGGVPPGANIPGVGNIGGASAKSITLKRDLANKTQPSKVYRWDCSLRKRNPCTEKDMIDKPASYNTDGILMIWRPYADTAPIQASTSTNP